MCDEPVERPNDPRFGPGVTKISKKARTQNRAARLHQEALNCLTIAVKEESHSAELIDEALRLAKRSRELNGAE